MKPGVTWNTPQSQPKQPWAPPVCEMVLKCCESAEKHLMDCAA